MLMRCRGKKFWGRVAHQVQGHRKRLGGAALVLLQMRVGIKAVLMVQFILIKELDTYQTHKVYYRKEVQKWN